MNAPFLNASYDVEAIRAEFPILSAQVYGKPLVYLDNAASAQKPRAVIDAMVSTMEGGYANVHRGLHYMANAATEAFEEARESVRDFLNAGSTDEVVFTRSATEAINLVADSFGRMAIGEGDEIILSIMEHHSNVVPWHFLRERKGAVIKWAPVDDEGTFLVEEFEKLFTPRTKLVAMTHLSNVLGTVVPKRSSSGMAQWVPARTATPWRSITVATSCACAPFSSNEITGPLSRAVPIRRSELSSRSRSWA